MYSKIKKKNLLQAPQEHAVVELTKLIIAPWFPFFMDHGQNPKEKS